MPGDKDTAATEGAPAAEANTEGTTVAQEATDTAKAEEPKAAEKKTEEGKATEEKAEEKKEEPPVPTMKCVVLMGFGGTRMMKVQQKPQPTPAQGQVMIRVNACGMGFQDLMFRQGLIENAPKTPIIMGSECAGVVEALGPDTAGFAVGDRVMALTDFKAWAELAVVPANQVYKLPDGVGYQDGVCLLTHYITAYILLFDLAHLREGQSLLIHSAAGGVGQAILQLCATVRDVTIYGTASSHKHDRIKDKVTHLFAHNVDYVQEIRKVCSEGVDIVLDCLCGEDTNRGIGLLRPLGKYILYGSSNTVAGETKSFLSFAKSWWQVDKVSPFKLFDTNHSVGGFHLRQLLFRQNQHAYIRSIVNKLFGLYADGKIAPVIDTVWAFEDVVEGMHRIQDRQNIGKVILDPGKEPVPKRADSKAAIVEPAETIGESGEEKKEEENSQKAETTETPAADAQ